MPVFQGATFPALGWIPDTDRLNTVGEAVLDVMYGALEQHGLHERYERRFVGHGAQAPVEPSRAEQLTVVCAQVGIGRASEQQFQVVKGEPGKLAFRTATFRAEISRPYPQRQGAQAVRTDSITAVRGPLWREGIVVWSALIALAAGGVSHPGIPRCEDIIVGPMAARDPSGGEASWTMDVFVQL